MHDVRAQELAHRLLRRLSVPALRQSNRATDWAHRQPVELRAAVKDGCPDGSRVDACLRVCPASQRLRSRTSTLCPAFRLSFGIHEQLTAVIRFALRILISCLRLLCILFRIVRLLLRSLVRIIRRLDIPTLLFDIRTQLRDFRLQLCNRAARILRTPSCLIRLLAHLLNALLVIRRLFLRSQVVRLCLLQIFLRHAVVSRRARQLRLVLLHHRAVLVDDAFLLVKILLSLCYSLLNVGYEVTLLGQIFVVELRRLALVACHVVRELAHVAPRENLLKRIEAFGELAQHQRILVLLLQLLVPFLQRRKLLNLIVKHAVHRVDLRRRRTERVADAVNQRRFGKKPILGMRTAAVKKFARRVLRHDSHGI
mmetsp:Transcript_2079/g.5041  ORF Transcript_2079/g.5041 Transcript_2079/m.5041 type:complete len:368 (+) Transcript_2079:1925-3028(+)